MNNYALLTQPPFCEYYQQDKNLPELGNSYSSLLYILLSLYSIVFSSASVVSTSSRVFLSILFLTGVSSFLFHYTLWNVMGNMDVISVLSLSYYGSYYCIDAFLRCLSRMDHIIHLLPFVWILAFDSALSLWFVPEFSIPLYYLVIPPQVFLVGVIGGMHIIALQQGTPRDLIDPLIYADLGALILGGSSIIPIYVDPMCSYPYLRTHTLWHIGSAYGVFLLFQAFLFIKCKSEGRDVQYNRSTNWFGSYWFYILPCVDHHSSERRIVPLEGEP
jgi:hypothetical protein